MALRVPAKTKNEKAKEMLEQGYSVKKLLQNLVIALQTSQIRFVNTPAFAQVI